MAEDLIINGSVYSTVESVNFKNTEGATVNYGVTPHIGDNKNWFIGSVDTGICAEGKNGSSYIMPPLFANDISECTDSTKLYVLPDGYIYAYVKSDKPSYTNMIPTSTDAYGEIYEGCGYKNDTRYNSSGSVVSNSGSFTTGYIPASLGDVIRFNGNYLKCDHNMSGILNMKFADKEFTRIHSCAMSGLMEGAQMTGVVTNSEGYITEFTLNPSWSNLESWDALAYVCFSLVGSAQDCVITVNEEISSIEENSYEWKNTQRVFVYSECEERIEALESGYESSSARISAIEESITAQEESILPSYWKDAADAISSEIKDRQNSAGARAFQFVWLSDIHGVKGYTDPDGIYGSSVVVNLGKVAGYVARKYDIPFVAISGDLMSQNSHSEEASVIGEYEKLRELLSPIEREKLLCTVGNHDGAWGLGVDSDKDGVLDLFYYKNVGGKKLYNLVFREQALDRSRVFGEGGSYFYVDTPQKVRFAVLNSHTDGDGSSDANGYAIYNSFRQFVFGSDQLKWFGEKVLNLPDDEWRIVVMAHAPVGLCKDGEILAGLINAYNNKVSEGYSGEILFDAEGWGDGIENGEYKRSLVDVRFGEKRGMIVGYFCGHLHKDSVDLSSYGFPIISITTAGADVRDAEPETRVPGSAKESALDIVTVDETGIYLTRLGAGEDRSVIF